MMQNIQPEMRKISKFSEKKRKMLKMSRYWEDSWIFEEWELKTSDNHVDNGDDELSANPPPSLHPFAADFWLYIFQTLISILTIRKNKKYNNNNLFVLRVS